MSVFFILLCGLFGLRGGFLEGIKDGNAIYRKVAEIDHSSHEYFWGLYVGMSEADEKERKEYRAEITSPDGNWYQMAPYPTSQCPVDKLTKEVVSGWSNVVAVIKKDGSFYFTREENLSLISDVKIVKNWMRDERFLSWNESQAMRQTINYPEGKINLKNNPTISTKKEIASRYA